MKPTYRPEDFVQNPSFQAWVDGDPDAAVFWTDWMAQYPDHQLTINRARSMVRARRINIPPGSENAVQQGIDRLLHQAGIVRPTTVIGDESTPLWLSGINWLRIVAWVLLFLGLGVGYYFLRRAEAVKMAAIKTRLTTTAPTR